MTSRDDFKTVTGVGPRLGDAKEQGSEIGRGSVIGRYTVLEQFATGGAAMLFSAYDAELQRVVALKVLRAQLDTPEMRTRLMRDAQTVARFKHPHVVTVHDVGIFGDRLYLAMELVDGTTLRDWVGESRSSGEVLRVLKAAGRGLAAAHEAGLVHRDFKPENVLVGKDGRVLVTNFGIARRAHHMAPHIAAAKPDSSQLVTHPRVTVRPSTPGQDESPMFPRDESSMPGRDEPPLVNRDEQSTVARRIDLRGLLTESPAPAKSDAPTEKDGAAKKDSSPLKDSAPPKDSAARPAEPALAKDDAAAATHDLDVVKDDDETVARKVDLKALRAEVVALHRLDLLTPTVPEAPQNDEGDAAKMAKDAPAVARDDDETVARKVNLKALRAEVVAPQNDEGDAAKTAKDAPAVARDDDETVARKVNLKALRAEAVAGDAAANNDEPPVAKEETTPTTSDVSATKDEAVVPQAGPKAITHVPQADAAPARDDDEDATVARKVDLSALKADAETTKDEEEDEEEEPTVALKIAALNRAAMTSSPPPATRISSRPPPKSSSSPSVKTRSSSPPAFAPPSSNQSSIEEGAVVGTPGYIAPELLFSGDDDARSDQFSFAVTMYVALFGKQPFRFHDLPTYCNAVQRAPLPPPPSEVSPWIQSVIERAMKQDSEERFTSMTDLLDALEHDPSRRRRSLVLGAIAASACIAGLVGYGSHRAELREQCEVGATIIAGIWNRDVEQRTRAALEHAGGPSGKETADRVASRLSAYAETWTATYRTVAERTLLRRENDEATMDRRLACLERGRDQLSALTEILAGANTTVAQHAVDAAFALPAPETCATFNVVSTSALPASPDLRARVRSAERAIAEAAAHGNAGEDQAAAKIVARALPDVRAIPHPRTEAELLLLESDSKVDGGDPRAALESSESAFQAAQRAGDDVLAARAAARIADLLSSRLDQPQDGERWMKAAEAIANRAGPNDALRASLLASRITVNAMLGRSVQNPELHDQEIALLERLYSKRDARVARAVTSRGVTLHLLGKFDRALEDIQTGIALLTAVAGSGHPHLVLDYTSLGAVLVSLGRLQDAKGAYERALSLQGDTPHGSLTVTILGALAGLEIELGTPDAAIEIAHRGLEVAAEADEKGAPEWGLRLVIAKAKGKKGDFGGQAEDCRTILNLQKAAGALTHDAPYTPDALTCLAQAELALRRVDGALGHLEESVTLLSRSEPADLALARFALAKALRTAGRDMARARELAENAREDLRKWPAFGQELAAVEQWLAEPSNAAPIVAMPAAPSAQQGAAPAASPSESAVSEP